jgi:uncharacterized membrane protein YhfC
MRRAATYGTGLVFAHSLINIVHGAAHLKLHIELSLLAKLFVVGVILLCPLLAGALLWTAQQRFGLTLLTLSMAGSLIFGLYHHFVVMGPDHVRAQASGPWAITFAVTAYLLAITEATGTYIGVRFLCRRPA